MGQQLGRVGQTGKRHRKMQTGSLKSVAAAEAVGEGDNSGGDVAELFGPKEHLTRDFARVRAKFAMDPPPGAPSLTAAWRSETAIEEDEAEFVDAVADCLGAGLSLQDALTCWETGHLAADDSDASAAEDESAASVVVPATPRRPTGRHRLVVR